MRNILRLGMITVILFSFTLVGYSQIMPNKVKIIIMKEGKMENSDVLFFDSNGRLNVFENSEYQYSDNYLIRKQTGGDATHIICKIRNGKILTESFDNITVEYSDNGYLTKLFLGKEMYDFFVENGKIIHMKVDGFKLHFLYGNARNNLNVDLSYFFLLDELDVIYSGLLGKRLEYLPTAALDENNNVVMKFTYEYEGEYLRIINMDFEDSVVKFEIYY